MRPVYLVFVLNWFEELKADPIRIVRGARTKKGQPRFTEVGLDITQWGA